jgi:hypothetical protein
VNDSSIPPDGVIELFERTPATKRMFILGRADHGNAYAAGHLESAELPEACLGDWRRTS